MTTAHTGLLDAALSFHEAGCCVVPARTDGSKAPFGLWKDYQYTRPGIQVITEWLTSGHYDGFGIITGEVSGHLEMLELEGRATQVGLGADLAELADNCGLGKLWEIVTGGYFEITPSGGFHLLFRVSGGPAQANTKLARRPATEEELAENPDELVKVLIETRGEGGFSIAAPSGGRTHPDGGHWMLTTGCPDTIPTITVEARDALYQLCRTFDQMPAATAVAEPVQRTPRSATDAPRPGDDYNTQAHWSDILTGWTRVYIHQGVTYWRRPGKNVGISATTGRTTKNGPADNLYVFTTSTSFDAEVPYSKFAAYTHLNHNGNWTAATKALAAAGYGEQRTEPTISTQTFTPAEHGIEGNLATVHQLRPTPDPDANSMARSDDGNALALVTTYGQVIRYCHDRGRWLVWDGTRWHWQPASGGLVREYAKTICRALPEDDNTAILHKRRSLGAIGTTAMLTQAATDPAITVSVADLDAHPHELNTPAGILNLRTGLLEASDPTKLHTRITSCAPDAAADTAAWTQFLTDTFGTDTDMIGYLQRLMGYSATGYIGDHVLPFCHGSGGNGKGVFLEACKAVLGDYATSAPVGFLMGGGFASHETEIASLAGARFVICSEVNEGDIFDEAKVKLLTGGDSLKARFMRQDHFTFTPSHHLWLMGNSQPTVKTGGESFWRRVRMVPFTRTVARENMVADLQGILAREHGPAILAWIAAGAASYATSGLGEPPAVRAATAAYATDQDTAARFLDDACTLGGGEHVKVKVAAVYAAYDDWCKAVGEVALSAKSFGRHLARAGIVSVKGGKGVRYYAGITLLSTGGVSPDGPEETPPSPFGGDAW